MRLLEFYRSDAEKHKVSKTFVVIQSEEQTDG